MKTRISTMAVVMMLLLVLFQAGCTEFTAEDKAFVKDLAMDWLDSKGMRPQNADGSLNEKGAANLAMAALMGSGDPEVDAVLGIYGAVSGVIGADKAMDEARASGNADAMDQVIASRPQDWTYRNSRATLALAQGDIATYQAQADNSALLSEEQGVPAARYARQVIKDYQSIAVPDKGEQGYHKYMDLHNAYAILYEDTGDEAYLVAASAAAMSAEAARD